jgi:hypothetical protein
VSPTVRSASPAGASLLQTRDTVEGRGLGHGYVALADWVVAFTRPGAARMPNGIEADIAVPAGAHVAIGGAVVRVDGELVLADGDGPVPIWDPVPAVRVRLHCVERFDPDPEHLAGRGPGLTPEGDDLLCGYAAGLVLWHGRRKEARAIAEAAAPRTTLLSATLLRHAARGELPEPAHALLERGDLAALSGFGRTSGSAIARGLALACGAGRAGAILC